jgi:hypothetical protein
VDNPRSPFNDSKNIGLAISSKPHRFTVPRNVLVVKATTPEVERFGPDLAFVRIPDPYAGSIEAKRSFWQMNKNGMKIPKQLAARNTGLWITAGSAEEMNRIRDGDPHFDHTLVPRTLVGWSAQPHFFAQSTWDYFDVQACYSYNSDLPRTFGGVSGGGLWHVKLSDAENNSEPFHINHPMLMGVAFYESQIRDGSRVIRCHGPKSIYVHLARLLDNTYR